MNTTTAFRLSLVLGLVCRRPPERLLSNWYVADMFRTRNTVPFRSLSLPRSFELAFKIPGLHLTNLAESVDQSAPSKIQVQKARSLGKYQTERFGYTVSGISSSHGKCVLSM